METPTTQSKFNTESFQQLVKNSTRLIHILWHDKKAGVTLLVFMFILLSATPFLYSGALAAVINQLILVAGTGFMSSALVQAIALLIAATVIPALLFTVQNYLSKVFWFYLEEKFELMIIRKKGEIDVASHEDPKQNDLFATIEENGTWRIQNFVDRQFFVLQNVIEVVIASVIIIYSQWWVFVILLLGTLPELVAEIKHGDEVWGIYGARAEIRRKFWDLKNHFEELNYLIETKLLGNINKFFGTLQGLFQDFRLGEKLKERTKLNRQLASLSLSQLVLAFATIWFLMEVVRGHMQIGTLTFILASMSELRRSLSSLFLNLGRQYQDSLFVTDIFKLLDTPPSIKLPSQGIVLDPDKTVEIRFNNLSFHYPGTRREVLKDFSLTIKPGEKVAIVGINGAGKTTLIKLLCRFYDPTDGEILVNGQNLKDIDLESWYRQLGIIFQEYAHYHFPVHEAIAVGDTSVAQTPDRVKGSAKLADADTFIEEWKGKYKQMLGIRFTEGVEPSVGQWQKLALARIFYRNPHIWILDEPTSSVDAEAEAKIFEKLEALPADRSVILISHRFSTVRHADQIVVIDEGVIKEKGTHQALIKKKGIYAQLFALQAKGYEE